VVSRKNSWESKIKSVGQTEPNERRGSWMVV
jgi:hypothetical protein